MTAGLGMTLTVTEMDATNPDDHYETVANERNRNRTTRRNGAGDGNRTRIISLEG